MAKWYTFNRPVFVLILLPLLFLMVMLIYGLSLEFNIMVILVILISLLFVSLIVYMSFLRRVRIDQEKAEWITPKVRWTFPLSEVRHFGVIKYRSFRFIFLSRSEELPYQGNGTKIVPSEDTFILQYRLGAWKFIRELLRERHPDLKPQNFTHQ